MTKAKPTSKAMPQKSIGEVGEDLISQWLAQLGWTILAQRWRCRWGELDIVALTPEPASMLIVVEVKVRSRGNWDNTGLLAVTSQKQAKLLRATELFLAEHELFANYPCRFDVALVQRESTRILPVNPSSQESRTILLQDENILQDKEEGQTVVGGAIAPWVGSPSAPAQAISSSQIPVVRVGKNILRLKHYLEGAFDAV